MWEEDRDALLANPDAIELPLQQITRALDFYGACGFVTVAEVQTRFRPAPRMRKALDAAR